jgi:hypothetical protein
MSGDVVEVATGAQETKTMATSKTVMNVEFFISTFV